LIDEKKDIKGLRLNLLLGSNADVYGIDLGLGVNGSKSLSGIQIAGLANVDYINSSFYNPKGGPVIGMQIAGLYNASSSVSGIQIAGLANGATSVTGIQVAGFLNLVENEMNGIQIGGINNSINRRAVTGAQIGVLNFSGSMTGIQIGGLNGAEENMLGVQIGLINEVKDMRGIQIGIYNTCKTLKGVQIGLINHIENGLIKYLPIVNAQF